MFLYIKLLFNNLGVAINGGAIAHNNRGAALLDLGRVDEAIVDLSRAIELDERLGKAYGNRAAAFNLKHAWEEAVADGSHAIELDSAHFAHYHERGLALFELGRFESALADFDGALRLKPTNAPSLASRAATYQMLGRFEEAVKDSYATLALDAKMVEPYATLADSLGNLRRFDEAMEAAGEYVKRRPSEWVGYHLRADLCSLTGDFEQASADYRQALSIDSGLPRSHVGLANIAHDRGDYTAAIEHATRSLAIEPSPVAHSTRAISYHFAGDLRTAMRDHDAAIALQPQDGVPYNNRGFTLHALKRYEPAILDYEHAILTSPEHPNAYKNFAQLLATCPEESYRDGQRAVQLAEEAMRLTEGRQTAWHSIVAAAHAEVGDFEIACRHQQQAIDTSDGSDRSEQSRRLALYQQGHPLRE